MKQEQGVSATNHWKVWMKKMIMIKLKTTKEKAPTPKDTTPK